MLASMSTALTMALSSNDILAFASAEKNTKDRAGTQRARLGSMCSGSGVGGLALHKCAECQSRSEGNLVEFECSSPCEIDRHKADWLKHLDLAPLVFEDITQMGLEQRCDWTSESSPPIPDVQVVLLWFSCKDLSIYNIPNAAPRAKADEQTRSCILRFGHHGPHDVRRCEYETTRVFRGAPPQLARALWRRLCRGRPRVDNV
ncbi:unnamed protein product [Prorocentrum cordatum]|uniref:Uncharacterized protein n=1 Tax=Prorocentrum cordatum TaxID=2364126 RepID=A0ABN9QIV9_9DINO|nr:unnamed protein product [Polarella glacialis]